jgi:hypothetical protein
MFLSWRNIGAFVMAVGIELLGMHDVGAEVLGWLLKGIDGVGIVLLGLLVEGDEVGHSIIFILSNNITNKLK